MKIKGVSWTTILIVVLTGLVVIGVALSQDNPKQPESEGALRVPTATVNMPQMPTATLAPGETPQPIPTLQPQPTGVAAGDRIVIGKIGVNAPLSFKTAHVNAQANTCVMPNPNGAGDVAIYNFAACDGNKGGTPGTSGNTILAGHVDLASVEGCRQIGRSSPCLAVFAEIDSLATGDNIELAIGGKTYRYQVTKSYSVKADDDLWVEIVTATKEEQITLITCEGDFNPRTREYTHRLVVVAKRIQ